MRVSHADVVEGDADSSFTQRIDRFQHFAFARQRALLGQLQDHLVEGDAGSGGIGKDRLAKTLSTGENARMKIHEEETVSGQSSGRCKRSGNAREFEISDAALALRVDEQEI